MAARQAFRSDGSVRADRLGGKFWIWEGKGGSSCDRIPFVVVFGARKDVVREWWLLK